MRKYYLDHIRWMTVLLVVLYHVVYMFNGILTDMVVGPFDSVQYQDAVLYLLYPWFMILLFIVSGISSRFALEQKGNREFLAARTRKLLVPSTVGLFVFQWMTGYVNLMVAGTFPKISAGLSGPLLYVIMVVSGTGPLWFIQMLWLFSVILLWIRRFEKGKLDQYTERSGIVSLLFLAVPLWLAAQILNAPVIVVYRFGIYGMAFFLGYFVFAHERVMERLSRFWLPLTISALLMGITYTGYYFGRNYAIKPVVNSPFSIAYGWVAILAIFAVMKKFGDHPSQFSIWMQAHSFGIYAFHYLPLSAAALWICKTNALSALPSYLITALAALLGSLILYELLSRIPVVRWCVLGIRKKVKKDVP